jgi:hypothetical protein
VGDVCRRGRFLPVLHRMVRDCLHNGSNPTNRNLAEEDSDLCFSFTLVSFPPRFI